MMVALLAAVLGAGVLLSAPLVLAGRDEIRRKHTGRVLDETLLNEPGDHPVDVPVVCVLTRFGLRSPRYLLPMYLNYRRVARDASGTPGLLRSAFLVEDPTTCYSLSLWADADAIPPFGTAVPSHVEVARRGFGWVSCREGRGPEVWSTKWELDTVSNNLNWDDFDLRGVILAARG